MNKSIGLQDYFDELLGEDEMLERSSARLAAFFDGQAEGENVSEQ